MFHSGQGNYAYTSARVKAMKSHLLKEEDYNKMLLMSVPEISHYISEAGYSKEMADLGNRHSGLELVEYATYANMATSFRSILRSSTGELRNMVEAYLTEWDFENLKAIIRGKHYGLDVSELREDLVPAGKLDADDLDDLLAAPGIEETIALFERKMGGVKVSEEAIASYKETHMLKDLEDEFVKIFFKNLLKSIKGRSRPNQIFSTYIQKVIDARNVETLLKLKAEGITGSEELMRYYVPGGFEVDEKVFGQIAAAPDMAAAANEMSSLKIGSEIRESMTNDASMTELVGAIAKYKADLAGSVAHMYPLSVIPVAEYMIHKRAEVRNIRMIAHGVDSGLDVPTMKSLLVI